MSEEQRPSQELTYREAGATRDPGERPPPGFHGLRVRTRLGHGDAVRQAAGQALTEWRMHRAAGVAVETDAPRAEPGADVTLVLGRGPLRLRAPCRVVWALREPGRRTGFAYGTLPGHPECGEEAFVVEQFPDGSVWLTVTAFSRSARWYTRAAGPLGRAAQRAMARWYGRALRRLGAVPPCSRQPGSDSPENP